MDITKLKVNDTGSEIDWTLTDNKYAIAYRGVITIDKYGNVIYGSEDGKTLWYLISTLNGPDGKPIIKGSDILTQLTSLSDNRRFQEMNKVPEKEDQFVQRVMSSDTTRIGVNDVLKLLAAGLDADEIIRLNEKSVI